MKNEILNFCDQLVAAAANGVYQGIIIALLVALGFRFLVRTNAATRHAVWFGTLLLLVALVGAHCVVDVFSLRRLTASDPIPATKAELALTAAEAEVEPETGAKTEDSLPGSSNFGGESGSARPPSLGALIQAQHGAEAVPAEPPTEIQPGNGNSDDAALAPHLASEPTAIRQLMERLLNPVSVELALGSKFPWMASLLFALWVLIAGFGVLTLTVQLARIQTLKRQSLLPGAELSDLFHRLSRLVPNRQVELRVSPAHRSAVLLGFLRPVVLLPAEERMELAEAELVLRHELAHVLRRDDWVNLIQHSLLAVFFFHPALWWISRQLSLEREIACDDHVLQQSQRPKTYALVLANLAARLQKPLPLLAPGTSNHKTQLKERIDMILNPHRNASPRLAKTWLAFITSMAAVVALAIICVAPRIVLAQIETTPARAAIAPPADAQPVLPVPVTAVAPVAAVAGVPQPGSADDAPPPPAAVGVGPRFKPGSPAGLTIPRIAVTVPAAALGPLPAGHPVSGVVATGPGHPVPTFGGVEPPSDPLRPARLARAPRGESRDSSLEERLDRLERMVNALMTQQNSMNHPYLYYQPKNKTDGVTQRKAPAESDAFAKKQADLARRINPQEIEKMTEQAKREAARAVEKTKQATAELEKANKADQKQAARKLKADAKRQLDELRKESEALERRKEMLDRQIERLEQDQEELDEQDEGSVNINTESREANAGRSESWEVCVTQSRSAQ